MPGVFLEAEFHAVWATLDGMLVDPSPKADGEDRILFLPDATRTYVGLPVENRRKLLVKNDAMLEWMWVQHNRHLIRSKCLTNGHIDPQQFDIEMGAWLTHHENEGMPKPGRNDICWCGSGKKIKRCCGVGELQGVSI
jgi:uncharacterized protein YchJ